MKNPTFELLQHHYCPDHWGLLAANPRRAYESTCPTVSLLAQLYGRNCPTMWIDAQLTALFVASTSRDASLGAAQAASYAPTFAAMAGGLKLTEVMLFMGRYKAGRYGRSYATFDMRVVGQAFHHEFLPERRLEVAALEDEALRLRRERDHLSRASHAMSREAFCALGPDTRFGLRLRPAPAAGPDDLQSLWLRAGIDPSALRPDPDGSLLLSLTRTQMDQLAAHVRPALLTVEDSWAE